jgi:hypothetical protein
MVALEPQEEDDPKCILFYNPISWLGQIRTHRRDESWSASLCQTFFSTSMDAQIPMTTGRLVNLVTFFAQHIQQKLNRWLEAGDNIAATWS